MGDTFNIYDDNFEKIRGLDRDERPVLDQMCQYTVKYGLAQKKKHNPWPHLPLLKVLGGAGMYI